MFINHKINNKHKLIETLIHYGVEIDVRWSDKHNTILFDHDLIKDEIYSENFFIDTVLKYYNHSLLILNIKESLCEEKCIEYLTKYNIKNYLFLDSQIPDIVRHNRQGNYNFIIRWSKYETLNEFLLKQNSKYIWVDSFGEDNIDFIDSSYSKTHELILVSPELHKKDNIKEFIENVRKWKDIYKISVCTDNIDIWEKLW